MRITSSRAYEYLGLKVMQKLIISILLSLNSPHRREIEITLALPLMAAGKCNLRRD